MPQDIGGQGSSDQSGASDCDRQRRRVDLRVELRAVFRDADDDYDFHERAAFLEYDCGLKRGDAERQAGAERKKFSADQST
jgi:hypothetical protein